MKSDIQHDPPEHVDLALTLLSRWFSLFSLRTTWWTVWCWWCGEASRRRQSSHTESDCLEKTPRPVGEKNRGPTDKQNTESKDVGVHPQSFWGECWPWGVGRRGSGSCDRWSRSSGSPASSWTCPDCWRGSGNTCACVCVERVVAALSGSTCVCLCIRVAGVATCVPSSSPRLVNRYSYPYAALQLSHTTW